MIFTVQCPGMVHCQLEWCRSWHTASSAPRCSSTSDPTVQTLLIQCKAKLCVSQRLGEYILTMEWKNLCQHRLAWIYDQFVWFDILPLNQCHAEYEIICECLPSACNAILTQSISTILWMYHVCASQCRSKNLKSCEVFLVYNKGLIKGFILNMCTKDAIFAFPTQCKTVSCSSTQAINCQCSPSHLNPGSMSPQTKWSPDNWLLHKCLQKYLNTWHNYLCMFLAHMSKYLIEYLDQLAWCYSLQVCSTQSCSNHMHQAHARWDCDLLLPSSIRSGAAPTGWHSSASLTKTSS